MAVRSDGKDSYVVALLRGVNVGGNKKVPMAELREIALGLGFTDVQTYIQSGNLVARTKLSPAKVESALEGALERHFGFEVPVVARSANAWLEYAKGGVFPESEQARPERVLLGVAKAPLPRTAAEVVTAAAKDGERVVAVRDALWIDFSIGYGKSKITPSILDRASESLVTTRNFRSVLAIADLVRSMPPRTRRATPKESG